MYTLPFNLEENKANLTKANLSFRIPISSEHLFEGMK